ncbi:hypothetical protein SMATCC274_44740 [Serratia marcescens]|nr:hypothetical protein SMATCC274_44740 [Serratia marcescens]
MKLIWTEPAIADRLAIYEWLELKNPAAAAENDVKIADAAARLVHHHIGHRAYPPPVATRIVTPAAPVAPSALSNSAG